MLPIAILAGQTLHAFTLRESRIRHPAILRIDTTCLLKYNFKRTVSIGTDFIMNRHNAQRALILEAVKVLRRNVTVEGVCDTVKKNNPDIGRECNK